VLLFGMLISRITQLTKDDVIEGGQATWRPSTATASCCHRGWRTSSASYVVRMSHDGRSAAREPRCHGSSPARAQPAPVVDILFGARLHRYGIDAYGGRNTGRLALAAELPASALADLTGIGISTVQRWSQWARRDWTVYVAQRAGTRRQWPE
jgi:hypothetical protein